MEGSKNVYLLHCYSFRLEVLVIAVRQDKGIKKKGQIEKEVKLSILFDNMILYGKDLRGSIKNT